MSFSFPICNSHFAQLSPQVDALNNSIGSLSTRINVLVPPDSFVGGIAPKIGLFIHSAPITYDLSISKIIFLLNSFVIHSSSYVLSKYMDVLYIAFSISQNIILNMLFKSPQEENGYNEEKLADLNSVIGFIVACY